MWGSNSSDLVSLLYSVFSWEQPKNMNTGQIQGYGNWMLFSQYLSLSRFSWSKIWIAHHYGCQQEWNNLNCIHERSLWLLIDYMRPREKTRKPAVRPLRSSRWRMKVAWYWAMILKWEWFYPHWVDTFLVVTIRRGGPWYRHLA